MYVIKILLFNNGGGGGDMVKKKKGGEGKEGMRFCLELQRGQVR